MKKEWLKMAEANQDESTDSNFEDDLDKMLQETADQLGGDVESQEAIDDLLTAEDDTALEGEAENVDDLVDALLEESEQAKTDSVIDEFAEDPVDEFGEDATDIIDEFAEDVTDIVDDVLDKSLESEPVDEFAADEDVSEEEPVTFDISDDDADIDDESAATVEESEPDVKEVAVAEPAAVKQEPAKQATSTINLGTEKAQDERITLLGNEITELRKHFNYSDAIEKIVNDEKKAKQESEGAHKKLTILSICALVIAILAISIGSTVLFFNLQLEGTVEEARNSLLDIEDEMAARTINPNDEKIKTVQARIKELQDSLDASAKELDLLIADISNDKSQATSVNTTMKTEITQLSDKVVVLETELEGVKKARSARKAVSRAKSKAKVIKPREWFVNLVSFKQRWYTDKKVASFKQQGIPTEVVTTEVNGEKWFRIRAAGFYSKAAAQDYADKIKRVLNLGSVWVSTK